MTTGGHQPSGKGRLGKSLTGKPAAGEASASKPATTKPATVDQTPASGTSQDVLLVMGENESKSGYNVLRQRETRLEVGELRPVVEGKPLDGELVQLHPRKESPALFDVDVQFSQRSQTEKKSSTENRSRTPAQVASKDYRQNWSRVFGSARKTTRKNQLN